MLITDFTRFFRSRVARSLVVSGFVLVYVGCDAPPEKISSNTASQPNKSSVSDVKSSEIAKTEQVGTTEESVPRASQAKGPSESTNEEKTPGLPAIDDEQFLKAALDGDASLVKRGVRQGIPVDFVAEDKRTALMLAAFNGHVSIVKYLLEHKATVDLRDTIQRTALMYAATGTNTETVQLLIDAGANVNATDAEESWTPLMMAAAEGQSEIVSLLLKHGANPAAKDVDGETALQFAASKGHQAVVELLSK